MIFHRQIASKSTGPAGRYLLSLAAVAIVAGLCFPVSNVIGYRSVALLLLGVVSMLAMRMSLYPVLAAATASALIWNFFFIPPQLRCTSAAWKTD